MNSVVQCLSNTKPLLEYLTKKNYSTEINTTNSGMKGALIRGRHICRNCKYVFVIHLCLVVI